jgi:hypothetical protein
MAVGKARSLKHIFVRYREAAIEQRQINRKRQVTRSQHLKSVAYRY